MHLSWFAFALLLLPAQEQPVSRVVARGTVRDASGAGIPGATVYIRGAGEVSSTDSHGAFAVTAVGAGAVTLVVTSPGFEAVERSLQVVADPPHLEITLALAPHAERVEVRAGAAQPSIVSGNYETTALDVYRTPGTNADIMRSIQMLPGLVRVDEGAGLFVRGGDVSETVTYLDRAYLYHPYRYETPTGGFFGTLPPYLASGISFSAGGFPARYGDALSGVLELTGLPRPPSISGSFNIGLGAVSAGVALPLGSRMGLRFSGNQSLSNLLFAVNPGHQRFSRYPSGTDLNAAFYFDSPRAGQFKVFSSWNREQVGVDTQQDAFSGILDSTSSNRSWTAQWRKPVRDWMVEGTLSTSAFEADLAVGVLAFRNVDSGQRLRIDASRSHGRWILRSGVEADRRRTSVRGLRPARGGDLGGVKGTLLFDVGLTAWRTGAYFEADTTHGRLSLNFGLRTDRFGAQRVWRADPRASLSYRLAGKHRLRFAAGIYHQATSPSYLSESGGNPRLRPSLARHWIAGYEYDESTSNLYFRLEVYRKQYLRLPLQDLALSFNDDGTGSSRGVDFYVKVASQGPWQGWATYSYLRARRKYTPYDEFGRYPIPLSPYSPEFEIPHTAQLVLTRSLSSSINTGASFRLASGKPFTPVIATRESESGITPVFGPINSGRLPVYQRLDITVSKTHQLGDRLSAILYLGINNLLDHRNVFAYAYSPDYSERRPATGSWGRTYYFGVNFQY